MKYLYGNKHWELNKEYNLDKLLYFMVDRPDKYDSFVFVWRNNKTVSHRDYDLPSFVTDNYSVHWYKNDTIHRKNNKPAYIRWDGYKQYWIHGFVCKNKTDLSCSAFEIPRLIKILFGKVWINFLSRWLLKLFYKQ